MKHLISFPVGIIPSPFVKRRGSHVFRSLGILGISFACSYLHVVVAIIAYSKEEHTLQLFPSVDVLSLMSSLVFCMCVVRARACGRKTIEQVLSL